MLCVPFFIYERLLLFVQLHWSVAIQRYFAHLVSFRYSFISFSHSLIHSFVLSFLHNCNWIFYVYIRVGVYLFGCLCVCVCAHPIKVSAIVVFRSLSVVLWKDIVYRFGFLQFLLLLYCVSFLLVNFAYVSEFLLRLWAKWNVCIWSLCRM